MRLAEQGSPFAGILSKEIIRIIAVFSYRLYLLCLLICLILLLDQKLAFSVNIFRTAFCSVSEHIPDFLCRFLFVNRN